MAPAPAQQKKSGDKSAKGALQELNAAVKLLNADQIEKGVARLLALRAAYPADPVSDKAKLLLLDYGVGDEVRITLDDRKVFRGSFKMLDKDILDVAEATLEELKPYYKDVVPFFKTRALRIVFYDSEARYRKAGGSVTSSGHFSMATTDFRARTLEGKIEVYLPKYAATLKDRQLAIKSSLYHEMAHYRNAICFAGALPGVFEEGLATYLQTRLNTEYYQYYRTTDRDEMQAKARNSLNSIAKYEDFAAFLNAERGFGQGGEMVTRWYGLCYAIIDFFEEGKLGEKKSSFDVLLHKVEAMAGEAVKTTSPGQRPAQLNAKEMLEKLIADVYEAKLEAFHKALFQHVLTKYKQR